MKMDAAAQSAAEARVVRAVAACVTDVMEGEWGAREWLHLFVDFEISADGGQSSSISFALTRAPGQEIEKTAFRLSPEAKRLMGELADGMADGPAERWTSAQLRLSPAGKYALDYHYEPPWRLGGNLVDHRFRDYLERWLASEEGARHRPAGKPFWQRILGR